METLGGECLFASEINEDLRILYKKNFNMECCGDINLIDIKKDIPSHSVLCAGFPCQPFSKAGKQEGFQDSKSRGNLFYKIMEILKEHQPDYILLENVPNLKSHDNGHTYEVIKNELETLYDIKSEILSPHYFGIPQHRTRIYIAGRLKKLGGLKTFSFPMGDKTQVNSIKSIIDENDTDFIPFKKYTREHIDAWEHFLILLKKNKIQVPSFPIWAMEFGATYDYESAPPCKQNIELLKNKKGKFGKPLCGSSFDELLLQLPIYAQTEKLDSNGEFPIWKKNFIKWNRQFYLQNKTVLDSWLPEIQQEGFENSHQKFEWNCGRDKNTKLTLQDKILQFRPSGLRVKLPTYSPALVLTGSQMPIFPWVTPPHSKQKGRYITVKEAARLQCMQDLKYFPKTTANSFKAFGNAVNVEVVRKIAKNLLEIQ